MKNRKIIFPLPFGSFCLVMRDAARTFYFIFLNRKSELAGTAIRTDIAGLQLHSPNIWLFYSSCHAFCFSNVRFSHAKTSRPFFYFHPSIDCAEKIELLGTKLKIFQISFVIYCVICRERSPLKLVHKIQNKNEMRNCKLFFSLSTRRAIACYMAMADSGVLRHGACALRCTGEPPLGKKCYRGSHNLLIFVVADRHVKRE